MSAPIKDGGPAFPVTGMTGLGAVVKAGGMTLRDWFAGQALAGWLADPTATAEPEAVAKHMYKYADAMLAERAKGGEA